ncbi:MAG: hypothetical protein LV471_11015 [Nitrosomonas sp.]|nr:hypothetical protein [Nitrosomonas sp.]
MEYRKDMRKVKRQLVDLSRQERHAINRRAHELAQWAEVAYRAKLTEIALTEKSVGGEVDWTTLETIIPKIDFEITGCDE